MPIIGLALDHEAGGGYSKLPWYAIRENYCTSVREAGGLPVCLPHHADAADAYLDLIDGLILIGGAFDIPPEMYGDNTRHETVTLKPGRTAFEWRIAEAAIARGMPLLGICGGEQLLNVVLGGTLIQHVPDAVPNALAHEQPNPRNEPGHTVKVTEGTLLHAIVGAGEMAVNSAHHQAVREVAPGMVVSAVAPDGVIEAIELPRNRHPFCLGVQWHPEYHVGPGDGKIFTAFVAAALLHSHE